MRLRLLATAALLSVALISGQPAAAHCDGLDGPVVASARLALEGADPNSVLIWVQPRDEPQIRRAFQEALEVRNLSPQAREMADRYFFETLVRLHRAGEGAPYTGLKPAGRDLGPAIPLADKAVATGSEQELSELLVQELQSGLRQRFADLQRKRNVATDDLSAGREYIASYVAFVHYAEGVYDAVKSLAGGHYDESAPARAEHHE
jgi:hypothetical protein